MSTRANIIIRDQNTTLYFYRHSDGYPSSTGEDLKEFCKGYAKNFRANAPQSAGFLILHGAGPSQDGINDRCNKLYDWKCGDYEPTDSIHGDVEYVYVIDLETMTLETREPKASFFSAKKSPTLKDTKIVDTFSIMVVSGKRGAL